MNQLIDLFSKKSRGPSRRRRHPQTDRFTLESLESRALLAVTLPPSISSDTVEIDDNLIVANGSWNVTATGGPSADGHVQIFGNSRGRIDGTPGDLNEDLTINADTFITVTGAIGATNRIDDLTLTSTTAQPVNLQQAVYITGNLRVTNAGSFTIGSTVDIDGNLVIDAATSVMFSGNVNVDGNLTITNATSVIFAGTLTVGGQLTITNVTGSTRFAGDVSVGAAAITSTALVQVQANFNTTGAAGDGDVTFTTDQINFATGTVESSAASGGTPSATLTVKPRTTSRGLTIGSPPGIPSGVNITDADLFAIQLGWKRVVFGDEAAGTGAVRIGSIGSQYGGFSQILNTTTIVGGTVQVVQPVDVAPIAIYLELIARGTGTPGSGSVIIDAPINQTVDERSIWVRLESAGSITLNAPIWSDQIVSLKTTAGGSISQAGSSAAITTVGLAVDADGSVTLADSGNAVSIFAAQTTNDSVVFREDSGYSISQITTVDDGRDNRPFATVSGIDTGSANVRLVTISGQTPSSVGQGRPIIANDLGLEGSNTDWVLTLSTNDVGTLGGFTGSINFRDVDDLTIDTVAAVSPRSSLAGITVARTLWVLTGTTLAITADGDISADSTGTAVTLTAPSGISTAGDIETSGGNAVFSSATTLTGDVVVDLENGPARGGIVFASTVQGTTSGQESLTIGGHLVAFGSIGSTTALESLSVSGDSTFTGGITLRTIGNQTYSGAATSTGTITIQAGSGSTVSFLGDVTLGGLVTATADTADYSVVLTGASVSVTNAMTFANTGTVTLGNQTTDNLLFVNGLTSTAPSTTNLAGTIGTTNANATFGRQPGGVIDVSADATVSTGSGDAAFNGTVDSAVSGGSALTVNATGTTTFAQAVGGTRALKSLATNAGGSTRIFGGGVATSGVDGQAYGDTVVIDTNDVTLTAGAGPVTFTSTVDNAVAGLVALTVNTTGGTTFGGAVGGTGALKSLTTNAGGTTAINGGSVTTSGVNGQAYGDAVEIGVNDATLTAGSGPVSFNGMVDSAVGGPFALSVNAGGTTTFALAVGGTRALQSLATNGGGTTAINGLSIRTSGSAGQVFSDAVSLGNNTTLDAAAGAINFESILDGAYTLAVNTTGTTTFGNAVGGTDRLVSLTTNAGGTTAINGGSIKTSGDNGQIFSDAVVLGNDTTLEAAAGIITFANTVDSGVVAARSLTVNTQGETWFAGDVGSSRPLASLTTDTGNVTRITADAVKTSGSQTYNDSVTFQQPLAPSSISTLSVPETLMAGSTVSLLQGLDAAGRSLRIEGNAVFGDQPGSPLVTIIPDTFVDPLLGLNGLTVTGSTTVNSNAVASGFTAPTNPITFQGPVTLGSSASIVGAGVRFQSTVAGPGRSFQVGSLAFGGSSSIVFDGDVGTLAAPLGPIDLVCLDGSVVINAAIHSTGPVTIKALSIDGDADNAIRVPTSTIALTAMTGIGMTTPIAVQAASVTASTWTGGIRLRGIGDLTVGAPGLIADSSGIDLTATGQIRVPGGNTIRAATGVTTNTPIRWGLLGTADSGSGSLRDVITKANATRAAGIIDFGSGQSTFLLQSPLPDVTTRLTINGTVGGGSVVLDGNGGVASGLVFTAQAAGSSLSNVLIRNFTGYGVQLVGAQNMVVDNIVVRGLNLSTSMGLYATGNLAGTTITGSVFSGGLRGALLDGARNLIFGQLGRGNTLANNSAAPTDPRFSGTGIRAQGVCQGTIVIGNTFTNNNYGFGFVNAQGLTLRQNTFSRNRVAAIYVDGNCTGSVQTGNSFATARGDRNGRNVMRFPKSRGA